jgi:hypothetical protein
LINLNFELTFFKRTTWKVVKTDRSVCLPAPLLFTLDHRNGWSLTEDELNAYIEEHPPPVHDEERAPRSRVSPPTLRISHMSNLIMTMRHRLHLHESQGTIIPMMINQPGAATRAGIDFHLGQKPKLGGRHTDDSLIYISYSVGPMYIHVLLSLLPLFLFLLSKT